MRGGWVGGGGGGGVGVLCWGGAGGGGGGVRPGSCSVAKTWLVRSTACDIAKDRTADGRIFEQTWPLRMSTHLRQLHRITWQPDDSFDSLAV